MNITMILQIATIVSAVLMVIAILLQQRGASLGAGFGGSGELSAAQAAMAPISSSVNSWRWP